MRIGSDKVLKGLEPEKVGFGAVGPENRSKIDYALRSKNSILGRNFEIPRYLNRVLRGAQKWVWDDSRVGVGCIRDARVGFRCLELSKNVKILGRPMIEKLGVRSKFRISEIF